MTKKEKAVAVAQDVIAQIKKRSNPLRVESANSFINTNYRPDETTGDLQDIIPDLLKAGCTVCARGAAVISKAKLFDKIPTNKVLCSVTGKVDCDREDTTELLKDVFSKTTLELMECAFEVDSDMTENPNKKIYGAVAFGSKYKDDKKRMVAIMQNIIDNGGEFVVEPAAKEQAKVAGDKSFAVFR